MKTFILCGGLGTRLDYEGKIHAKPMVRIGNKPILIHIIENFYAQGFNKFVLCLGYNSKSIVNYFVNEKKNNVKVINRKSKSIKIRYKSKILNFEADLVFTGINSGTGGRIKFAYEYLNLNEDFLMTYGDGLSNISIKNLLKFHYKKKAKVTVTAVRPKQRYGVLKIIDDKVSYFDNSKKKTDVYINGGYHVISKQAVSKIKDIKTYWEKEPLNYFKKKNFLFAFKHEGFWKSLDTLKDKNDFNLLFKQKKYLWKLK